MATSTETDLTPRQRKILALYATGKTRKGIGAVVFVGEWTVRDELVEAQEKLGAENLRQAVAIAFARGIIVSSESGDVRPVSITNP